MRRPWPTGGGGLLRQKQTKRILKRFLPKSNQRGEQKVDVGQYRQEIMIVIIWTEYRHSQLLCRP